MTTNSSPRFVRRWLRHIDAFIDDYAIRISIGLIASLLLVLGLTQIPIREAGFRVGWVQAPASERIQLRDFVAEEETSVEGSVVASESAATQQATQHDESPNDLRSSPPEHSDDAAQSDSNGDLSGRRPVELAALGTSGQVPQIVGGHGSLYLRIDYPEEARREGIEGRVVLEFVIDPEGFTRDIHVMKSLHPLCDSSAVAALQQTRFVPGRRDGEKVPVRMRLPIRFRLLNYTATNTGDVRQTRSHNP